MSKRSRQKARAVARGRPNAMRRGAFVVGGVLLFGVAAFLFLRPELGAGTGGPAVAYAAPVLGDPNAPVTIVEYGDFQCPSCGAFFGSVEPELKRRYIDTGRAKLVFKNFPWIGPESKRAAEAAACAGAQGKFWEYHDALYANQHGENTGFLSPQTLKTFAARLGLDAGAFGACFDSGAYRGAVDADFNEVRRLGLTGTPTFLINGQRVVGAQSFPVFAGVIDAKLRG